MLNAMREGAKSGFMKFFLFSFLVLAVGGLVLMDVGGVFRGGVARTAVAKINGTELSIITFDRMLRRILANQGLDTETAYRLGFINQVLMSEVNNNLMQHYAVDHGIMVGNQAVAKQINKLIEPLVTEEIDRKAALNSILRRQGLTERDFIRMVKAQMTNTLLQNTIEIGTTVKPKIQALDLYQHKNEKRTVKAVYFPHSKVSDFEEPDEAILRSFYQAGQERYAIPEMRSFTVAILEQDELAKTLDISDEELRDIYERDIASFQEPEKRVLEQAIVDSKALSTAIVNRINEGSSLQEAVKAETESEEAYLGEDVFEQDGLLEEVATPAFEAEKNALVGPVQSALGWHILKVSDILPPETKPFADVKETLRQEMIEVRLMDEMFMLANSIDDRLAGGASLEDVAEEMGLTLKTYGPVKADGSTPEKKDGVKDFGPDGNFITETVFDLLEGEISPVTELEDGRYAAIRVDKVTAKSYQPFEEVKDKLRETWIQDQKEVANTLLVEDLHMALKNGKTDLQAIAREHKVEIKTYNLARAQTPPEPLGQPAQKLFFFLPQGQTGAAPAKDGYLIGQVESITLPPTKDLDEELLQPVMEVALKGGQEEFMQFFVKNLHSDYKVKINEQLITETYGPGGTN